MAVFSFRKFKAGLLEVGYPAKIKTMAPAPLPLICLLMNESVSLHYIGLQVAENPTYSSLKCKDRASLVAQW